MMPKPPGPHLAIRRDDLRQFLPGLARLGGKSSRDEAVIGYADGEMWVRAGGMEAAVPASGFWPGEAMLDQATAVLASFSASSSEDGTGETLFEVSDGDHHVYRRIKGRWVLRDSRDDGVVLLERLDGPNGSTLMIVAAKGLRNALRIPRWEEGGNE